jgi:hypothetical protein
MLRELMALPPRMNETKNPTSLLRNGVQYFSIDTPLVKSSLQENLFILLYTSYLLIPKMSINFNQLFVDCYCRVSNLKVQRDYYQAIEVVMEKNQALGYD